MRLEQLYIFEKVADTGSMRRAAEALYLSAQSVSKSMLQLEAEWNGLGQEGWQFCMQGDGVLVFMREIEL